MPKGKIDPANIPDDGLTTKQRRSLPITAIHTGPGKGKSTAAFGMALRGWNNGFNIGVFQFVKSKTWNSGEEAVFKRLGQLHDETGVGGAVEWQKLGEGWSWLRKTSSEEELAQHANKDWQEIKRRLQAETHDMYILDEFTYPITWGWIDIDDVVETLQNRPGTQHVIMTGRNADPKLIEIADLVTEMTKVKHPMDAGRKGQAGIEW